MFDKLESDYNLKTRSTQTKHFKTACWWWNDIS